jgi:hypothetical protein
MQDFKYFTYGYSIDSRLPLYGLYHPVLNCFLIVLPDYDSVGLQLAAILSSRYLLQPVYLTSANNYTHNIIDNEVCERWAISNFNEIPASNLITGITVIPANVLIPVATSTKLIKIEKEKQWAQFCLFWLRFIKLECGNLVSGIWIDDQIGDLDIFDVFEPLLPSNHKQFITKTMQLLYLGQDVQRTEQAIIDIINSDHILKDRLEIFFKKYNA